MIKNIFYKIMADDGQRQKMNSLKDQSKIYNLFCENGYAGSFDDFKKEMKDFLNSDDSLKIIHNDFDELSDEMLELVAGGANVKKLVTASIATLMLTFTVSATLGSSLFQGNNVDNDTPLSVSSESYSDGDNKEDNSKSNGGTSKSMSGPGKTRGRSASVGSVRRRGRPSGQSGSDRRAFNPISVPAATASSNADHYKKISSHGLFFDDFTQQHPEFLEFLEQNPEIAKHMAEDYHFSQKMMYNNDFRNRVMNDASFRNELIKNGFKENLTNTNKKDVSKSNNFNQQRNRQDDKLIMINRLNNVVNIHKRSAQEYAKNVLYLRSKELKTVYRKLATKETTAAQHLSDMVNELKSGAIEDIADSNYAAQYKAVRKEIDDLKKETFKADYALLEKEVKLLSDKREKMNNHYENSASDDTKERDYKKMIMDYDKVIKNIQKKTNNLLSIDKELYSALGPTTTSSEYDNIDKELKLNQEHESKFMELKLKAEKEQNIVKKKEQQLKEQQKQREQKRKQQEQDQKKQQKQKQIATLEEWVKLGDNAKLSENKEKSPYPGYATIAGDYMSFRYDANKLLADKDTDKYNVEKAEKFIKSNKKRVEDIFKAARLNYNPNMFK